MRRLLVLAVALFTLFAVARLWSRQTGEPPVLSVRTELVTLTVAVVDRHGGFVTGLRRDQFTVYDGGTPQPIEFFSGGNVPATVGLLIDNSYSMHGRHDDIVQAAMAFVRMRGPADELFVLNFNDSIWTTAPVDIPRPANEQQLRAALAARPPRGMTAVYDAVLYGLARLDWGVPDRRALILVSDGGDNNSRWGAEDVLQRARRGDAAIYPVTFYDPDNQDARPAVLKSLADATGGQVMTARRPADATREFVRIADAIRSSYAIGFAPAPSAGGFRPIRVVVDGGDRQLTARTRAGYYAAPATAAR